MRTVTLQSILLRAWQRVGNDATVKTGGLNAASQILPLAVEIQKQLAALDKPAED